MKLKPQTDGRSVDCNGGQIERRYVNWQNLTKWITSLISEMTAFGKLVVFVHNVAELSLSYIKVGLV